MKRPQWFTEWEENDYTHLVRKVEIIEEKVICLCRDAKWIKWLLGFVIASIIGGAIAIICVG